MISFEHVSRSFSGKPVLNDVSFSIGKNETVTLTGPSGCGKTTLLRLIAGTLRPDTGTIRVSGRRTGFVFQDHRLLPWHTARENVALVLRSAGQEKAEARDNATRWLEQVGLADHAGSYPGQLSGGMVQRVSIARAFAIEPEIILMDEPFSSLDVEMKDSLLMLLGKILAERHTTVVYVTHDVMEAIRLGDRLFRLEDGTLQETAVRDREGMLREYCSERLRAFTPSGREE